MLIRQVIEHKEWSERIRRRGSSRVAREVGMDRSDLSKMVNNKMVVGKNMLERLRIATNNLRVKGEMRNG